MTEGRRYRKKVGATVVAVQLQLDTEGFSYHQWDAEQRCKPGDWLIDNEGDHYSVDQQVFADTYEQVSPGVYRKRSQVWAGVTTDSGTVNTKEGSTAYVAGDYLVSNHEDGTDAYAVAKDKFESMYESCDE